MTRHNYMLMSDIDARRRFVTADTLPDELDTSLTTALLPAPGQDSPPTVGIHYVTAGQPEYENVQSLLMLATSHDLRMQFVGVPNGPYMDQGRNRATFNFLSLTDCEWMLCLDDDVADGAMPARILDLIDFGVRHRAHVIGGCYASPRDGTNYVVAYHHPPRPDDADSLDLNSYIDLTVAQVDAMSPDDPESCRVAAIGTGFLLIHRSVLELMTYVYPPPQPWFAQINATSGLDDDALGTHLGEDLTFCRRLIGMGVPVHLHPAVRLTHFKKLGITLPPHPSRLSS